MSNLLFPDDDDPQDDDSDDLPEKIEELKEKKTGRKKAGRPKKKEPKAASPVAEPAGPVENHGPAAETWPEPQSVPAGTTDPEPSDEAPTKAGSVPSGVVRIPAGSVRGRDRRGLLMIGDPHLEARVPGFRRDDFPAVALGKFRWCVNFAASENLQPFLLGDLFQLPRDNPNWLLSEIFACLTDPIPAIYGNHDVRENLLMPHDSINLLFTSGHLHLLSDRPWIGSVQGHPVVVGGSSWGQSIPEQVDSTALNADLVVWLTHHDIISPGYESGRLKPAGLPGIDLVVNGHIHRRLETVSHGSTHWMTPGNITRRTRSDASRTHLPAVLRIRPSIGTDTDDANAVPGSEFRFTVRKTEWIADWIEVPHAAFDDVFHEHIQTEDDEETGSAFIADLAQLTKRRTETGAGLMQFLTTNVQQFEEPVAAEIMRLAREVTHGENES
ncbi:MAG: hypothetical protein R3C49_27830 [Planctomycetaceae bacterium]